MGWEGTCLTDSAISGPMPSPGNRVAVIGVVDEKALVSAGSNELWFAGDDRTRLEPLPATRLRIWEAIDCKKVQIFLPPPCSSSSPIAKTESLDEKTKTALFIAPHGWKSPMFLFPSATWKGSEPAGRDSGTVTRGVDSSFNTGQVDQFFLRALTFLVLPENIICLIVRERKLLNFYS